MAMLSFVGQALVPLYTPQRSHTYTGCTFQAVTLHDAVAQLQGGTPA